MNRHADTHTTTDTLSTAAEVSRTPRRVARLVRRALTALVVVGALAIGLGAQPASALSYRWQGSYGSLVWSVSPAREVRLSGSNGVDQGLEVGPAAVTRSNGSAGMQLVSRGVTFFQWTTNGWMNRGTDSAHAYVAPGQRATFNAVDMPVGSGTYFVRETYVWLASNGATLGWITIDHNQPRDYQCQTYSCSVGSSWINI